jgi:hypothetical protein
VELYVAAVNWRHQMEADVTASSCSRRCHH